MCFLLPSSDDHLQILCPWVVCLIAFEDYNVIDGVTFGSKWVGLEYFRRFLASPDFMNYLVNTLKLSIYGLL